MMRLATTALPAPAATALREYQREVDARRTFPARVRAADELFKRRNTNRNTAFRAVRRTLHEMCCGARRCCYCEDSCADEVEHVRPKSLYPEFVFLWENFVYACGPCNGSKNNRYAVFPARGTRPIEANTARGTRLRPPPAGRHVLIDPRREDPLDFMELDLLGTFHFVPTAPRGTREHRRAEYTIEILRLNTREVLPQARRCAFFSYRARLREIGSLLQGGATSTEPTNLKEGIRRMPHPSVWAEMKRQHLVHAELSFLFAAVPEALTW